MQKNLIAKWSILKRVSVLIYSGIIDLNFKEFNDLSSSFNEILLKTEKGECFIIIQKCWSNL